jgi:hypothetical protein
MLPELCKPVSLILDLGAAQTRDFFGPSMLQVLSVASMISRFRSVNAFLINMIESQQGNRAQAKLGGVAT